MDKCLNQVSIEISRSKEKDSFNLPHPSTSAVPTTESTVIPGNKSEMTREFLKIGLFLEILLFFRRLD